MLRAFRTARPGLIMEDAAARPLITVAQECRVATPVSEIVNRKVIYEFPLLFWKYSGSQVYVTPNVESRP